ncbi:MAG: exonuclease SbcCD subunit D [Clostridia bacterium]|nr:exonuclease SbcCD subunit D [Clostridia bacterium]
MKLLHVSDLHLGKRVYETSMIEDQKAVLEQILAFARRADVTLISGDIYDRPVPPAEAVALLDSFLTRMHAQGSPVALISGNHDSAERIAFGGGLMEASGVHVSAVYDGAVRRVELHDEHGAVHLHLLPFVKPSHVRAALGEAVKIEDYTDAIEAAISHMDIDADARNVLLCHQFVTGAQRSGSEEMSVGGLDDVSAQVFDSFDYVALGHIHRAQRLCGGRVRYCGAPLCYDFSEAGQQKAALLVELGKKGEMSVEPLPFMPLRAMRTMRGSFAEVARPEQMSEDYLEIVLTDEDDVPEAMGRLRALYPNLLHLRYDNARTRAGEMNLVAAKARRTPQEWMALLFSEQNGREMDEAQRALLDELVEEIWEVNA